MAFHSLKKQLQLKKRTNLQTGVRRSVSSMQDYAELKINTCGKRGSDF